MTEFYEPQTQPQMSPPSPPGGVAILAGFPHEELGDRIAKLSFKEARQLVNYLRQKELRLIPDPVTDN